MWKRFLSLTLLAMAPVPAAQATTIFSTGSSLTKSLSLPQCGGRAGVMASNFGPKLVLTHVEHCSNLTIDGHTMKMFRAQNGLYHFEMTMPDWDERHSVVVASNSKHTLDTIDLRATQGIGGAKPYGKAYAPAFDVTQAIAACRASFYDSKSSLACIDLAKEKRISSLTIESCNQSFYNSQKRLACIKANRSPKEIEACTSAYGSEEKKVNCLSQFAMNPRLTPQIVEACMAAFVQAENQMQCLHSAGRDQDQTLAMIRNCESRFYGDGNRLACIK